MKSVCRMLLYLVIFILKISYIVCQNNTICGNITCSPNAHGCSLDGNSCRCVVGYKGSGCEDDVDECKRAHHPLCGNTGICKNTLGLFNCECLPGWYGQHCKNRNQSVVAECLPGWTGRDCDIDIDECQNAADKKEELCQNSSTCVNNDGSYSCSCLAGWQGLNCSKDINECEIAQPCGDLSTCLNTPGSFTCTCAYGCQAQPDIATNTGLIVGLVVGSLLILLGIIVVLVVIKYGLCKSRKITNRGSDEETHVKASDDASNVIPTTSTQCPRGQLQEIVMKTTVAINKASP